MCYSLTVKELKEWINKIPVSFDMEQIDYLGYDGISEPVMSINYMFKKKLSEPAKKVAK